MSITDEWLECYRDAEVTPDEFRRSAFWRLAALGELPLGVDESDSRVQAALVVIRQHAKGCGDVE